MGSSDTRREVQPITHHYEPLVCTTNRQKLYTRSLAIGTRFFGPRSNSISYELTHRLTHLSINVKNSERSSSSHPYPIANSFQCAPHIIYWAENGQYDRFQIVQWSSHSRQTPSYSIILFETKNTFKLLRNLILRFFLCRRECAFVLQKRFFFFLGGGGR